MDDLKQKIFTHLETLARNPAELVFAEVWNDTPIKVSKNEKLSVKARRDANNLFEQKSHDSATHHKILHLYNESIAFAPNRSEELAKAYGNKAALLRHIRKYAECITEIDKALKITESTFLKVKLLCRKAACLTALGSPENRACLEKARFIFAKSSESESMKQNLTKMIGLTQLKVDANKLDKPKENQRVMRSSKIASEAEDVDIWGHVRVEYNEKYGKHLVAARDFEPGETIFVEKPYMKYLNVSQIYMYCSHCWNYLWTAFPCDHCAWRIYCSEKCKIDALDEYHDIECNILVQMVENSIFEKDAVPVPLLVGTFIKVMKDAGSINQLQKDSEYIDKNNGIGGGRILPDGLLNYHKIILSLPFFERDREFVESCAEISVRILVCLAKYSSIFTRTYNFFEIGKLKKNDAALFSGALILKLFLLVSTKIFNMRLIDPCEETIVQSRISFMAEDRSQRDPCSFYPELIGSLIMVHCVPNVLNCLTYNNRHLTISLGPIKKGTLLIASSASIYELLPKADRQFDSLRAYGCPCDCQACTEDWSEILADHEKIDKDYREKHSICEEWLKEAREIDQEMMTKSHKLNFPDSKLITKAANLVSKSWKHFPMPSINTVKATQNLEVILGSLHMTRGSDIERIPPCKS